MKKTFFTSDNHFWHRSILNFCPMTRFGETVEDMNELMIERWNQQVRGNDFVYCLGDFSFGTAQQTESILERLNGNKTLVYGNHDKVIRKNPNLQEMFSGGCHEYINLKIGGRNVMMSHYPMREWDRMHYGSFHLYGHVHGKLDGIPWGRSMDVGIDTRYPGDMGLWSWEEIEDILSDRDILGH